MVAPSGILGSQPCYPSRASPFLSILLDPVEGPAQDQQQERAHTCRWRDKSMHKRYWGRGTSLLQTRSRAACLSGPTSI